MESLCHGFQAGVTLPTDSLANMHAAAKQPFAQFLAMRRTAGSAAPSWPRRRRRWGPAHTRPRAPAARTCRRPGARRAAAAPAACPAPRRNRTQSPGAAACWPPRSPPAPSSSRPAPARRAKLRVFYMFRTCALGQPFFFAPSTCAAGHTWQSICDFLRAQHLRVGPPLAVSSRPAPAHWAQS